MPNPQATGRRAGEAPTRLVRTWAPAVLVGLMLSGCCLGHRPGAAARRCGDEIVAAGRWFHTRTPVVLWTDPGGYDAYRVERRFAPASDAGWEASQAEVPELTTPNRYGARLDGMSPEEIDAVRTTGWDLERLRNRIDQLVIHYDGCGTSRRCFEVLHDRRGLSAHFLLDLDGTIYQTLDLKERAWHATVANSRSIGIEIANIGAFRPEATSTLDQWYVREPDGRVRIRPPGADDRAEQRARGFVPRPARDQPIRGTIQGRELVQYDFTRQQYKALRRLTAALHQVFPKLRRAVPRDESGEILRRALTPDEFARFRGVLGHYHIQTNKVDPGPAFRWERVLTPEPEL